VGHECAEGGAARLQRNDAAIAKWLSREYPAIAQQAKQELSAMVEEEQINCSSSAKAGY